jgi:hypothetical protein
MNSHGAAVCAKSQMGRGLCFNFSLPRLEVENEKESPGHR